MLYVSYRLRDGSQLQILVDKESAWLTTEQIAQLYGKPLDEILEHLKQISKKMKFKPNVDIKEVTDRDANDPVGKIVKTKLYSASALFNIDDIYECVRGLQVWRWSLIISNALNIVLKEPMNKYSGRLYELDKEGKKTNIW